MSRNSGLTVQYAKKKQFVLGYATLGEIDADLPEMPKQLFPTPIYGDEKDGG